MAENSPGPKSSGLVDGINWLGSVFIKIIGELGAVAIFFAYGSILIFSHPFQFKKIVQQNICLETYFIWLVGSLLVWGLVWPAGL